MAVSSVRSWCRGGSIPATRSTPRHPGDVTPLSKEKNLQGYRLRREVPVAFQRGQQRRAERGEVGDEQYRTVPSSTCSRRTRRLADHLRTRRFRLGVPEEGRLRTDRRIHNRTLASAFRYAPARLEPTRPHRTRGPQRRSRDETRNPGARSSATSTGSRTHRRRATSDGIRQRSTRRSTIRL